MQNRENDLQPILLHAEPVFPVMDVSETVATNVPTPATIGLVTGENLAPFYQQFGFTPVFGMQKSINRTRISG